MRYALVPSNLVRTKRDEAAWDRAKRAAHSQYDFSEENDRFWKIVNHIYQNMRSLDKDIDAMDQIDQDDDAEAHRTGHLHKALPVVTILPQRSAPMLVLTKSYVRAHTRTTPSGRTITVPAYFTKKVSHPKEGAKERAPRALK